MAAVDDLDRRGGFAALRSDGFELVEDWEALRSDLAKHDVLAVEPVARDEAEEELRAVGAWASVGHGEDALASVCESEVLVGEFGTVDRLATSSVAGCEVTALSHEAWDDSVEGASLEVQGLAGFANALLTCAQTSEVLRSDGCRVEQINLDSLSSSATNGDVHKD